MLGDKNRDVLAENSLKFPFFTRALLDLNSVPLNDDKIPTVDNDLVYSNLQIYITYKPYAFKKYRDRPYILFSDMLKHQNLDVVRFSSLEHLRELAKENKDIAFILKWCTIEEEHLKLAYELAEIKIPVYFNVVKYRTHLKDMIETETGERPEIGLFQIAEDEEINHIRVGARIDETRVEAADSAREYRRREAKKRRASK